jgi:hypothetical protein
MPQPILEDPMRRTNLALVLFASTLALAAACKHDDGQAGITTIRSGTPEGVRVTNTPTDATDPAIRLARAVCRHERECTGARGGRSPEALSRDETACATELEPVARLNIEELNCSPAAKSAGLEECLAAIDSERCYEQDRSAPIQPECRASEICRRGALVSRAD